MEKLRFAGTIVNGIGKHRELVVPGCNEFTCPAADWPERLFPGSLNVRVLSYPDEFVRRGLRSAMDTLDSVGFEPEFAIPQALLGNNRLTPVLGMPDRGKAQVWRASVCANNVTLACWVLRRIGSALTQQIELVSSVHMRALLGADNTRDWPAVVAMQGRWRAP
jgi:hypothetical protein